MTEGFRIHKKEPFLQELKQEGKKTDNSNLSFYQLNQQKRKKHINTSQKTKIFTTGQQLFAFATRESLALTSRMLH